MNYGFEFLTYSDHLIFCLIGLLSDVMPAWAVSLSMNQSVTNLYSTIRISAVL